MDRMTKFWQKFRESNPGPALNIETPYDAWSFGDSSEMADKLGKLVLAGVKTATCSLLWEYAFDREIIPVVGERSIITNGEGLPLCMIETIAVEIKPYCAVDEAFAWAEGEGDRSLRFWREAHWRFFSKVCRRIGREIDETMPLVCERFRVIYPHPDLLPRHDTLLQG